MEFSDQVLRFMSLTGLKDYWAGLFAFFIESLDFVDLRAANLKTKADLCSALWAVSR